MGQAEVLDLLKKKETWMTTTDISEILKQGKGSISNALRKLEMQGEVLRYERSSLYGGNLWRKK